jgi:hypothetical protein
MNIWVWRSTFPVYSERLKAMAEFVRLGFSAHRVNSLSLVPKD